MIDFNLKKGDIILAEPFMENPHFKDAVIVITEHSENNGTVGFIINKTLKLRMKEVVEDFPEIDLDLLYGGPVQTDTLHYVHTYGDILSDSLHVTKNLYWGGDFMQLKALIRQRVIQPEGIRFYLGYSGWSPGQLEEEFEEGTWMQSKLDLNYLFKTKLKKVWPRAMADKGNEFTVIAKMPGSISWN